MELGRGLQLVVVHASLLQVTDDLPSVVVPGESCSEEGDDSVHVSWVCLGREVQVIVNFPRHITLFNMAHSYSEEVDLSTYQLHQRAQADGVHNDQIHAQFVYLLV